jgi:phosphomannomutase
MVSVPVGFPRIYREVLEGDVILGAEEYGGICVPAHLHERDGLLVALLAVELLATSGVPMSQLVSELESKIGSMRYTRRDVRLDPAVTQAFRNVLPGLNPPDVAGRVPVEVSHADGLRLQFEDDSWVLMRPSRAGALVRVYAEAPSECERDELLEGACDIVRQGV